jgi:RNA polymerase sigma-70 factor (ECF subfamily)
MSPPRSTQVEGVKQRSLVLRGRLEQGDSSLEGLYDSEFIYVWNSLRRLGIRDADLPDLTHDVFVKAFSSLHEYDKQRPLQPWLFGVAFRVAMDFRRLARHRREVFGKKHECADDGPSASEQLEAAEGRQRVLEILEGIEASRRAVFVMRELNGHSVREIAEALSIPVNTVYSRLRLAWIDFGRRARRLRLIEISHE